MGGLHKWRDGSLELGSSLQACPGVVYMNAERAVVGNMGLSYFVEAFELGA